MFAYEVIVKILEKKEETGRPVGRSGKCGNSISVNELHHFNDLLEVDKWYNEKYSKLYIELIEPKSTRKRFSSQKKRRRRNKAFFYLACGNHRETVRTFQLQDSTVRKIFKGAPSEKSESHQGFKGGKV